MRILSSSSTIILVFIHLWASAVHADIATGAERGVYPTVLRRALDLCRQRDFTGASAILEDALARASTNKDSVLEATILNDLGTVYLDDRKYDAAERSFKRSIALWTEVAGPRASALASPLGNLGSLYYQAGQYSRAEKLTARSVSILKETQDNPSELATLLSNLGTVYLAQHKEAVAQRTAEEAIALFATLDPKSQAGKASAYSIIGAVHSRSGEYADAESCLQQALAIWQKAWGPYDPRTGEGTANLAILYSLSGEVEKSKSLFEKAEQIFARAGTNDAFLRHFLTEYAVLQRKLGHKSEARQLARRVDELSNGSAANTLSRDVIDVSAFRSGKK
jgi:tetratricopeptide (TPR) repeat protein